MKKIISKLENEALQPKWSFIAIAIAIYFASIEERATTNCLLLCQDIKQDESS